MDVLADRQGLGQGQRAVAVEAEDGHGRQLRAASDGDLMQRRLGAQLGRQVAAQAVERRQPAELAQFVAVRCADRQRQTEQTQAGRQAEAGMQPGEAQFGAGRLGQAPVRPAGRLGVEQAGARRCRQPGGRQGAGSGEREQRLVVVSAACHRLCIADDQRHGARLVKQPALFAEQAAGGAAGNLQRTGRARGSNDRLLRVACEIAGEEEDDALGTLEAGATQGQVDGIGGQFGGGIQAAGQAAGDLHAALPLKRQRSATTQRSHSGLRALHT